MSASPLYSIKGLGGADLTIRYQKDRPPVITGQSILIPPGKVSVFIGPNGCGKSTLLKTLARQLVPEIGNVVMDGQDVARMTGREMALALLTERFQLAELFLPQVAIELGHENLRRRVIDFPLAGDCRARAGNLKCPLQAEQAFATGRDEAQARFARGKHDQFRSPQVERADFLGSQNAVIAMIARSICAG